jgi:hypothetical protein
MNEDLRALERALRNRRTELQRLIGQMISDNMNNSSVFRNLNKELEIIEEKLKKPVELQRR